MGEGTYRRHSSAYSPHHLSSEYVLTEVLTRSSHVPIFLSMPTKTTQLQIRISPAEKCRLRVLAQRSGLDVSQYVLQRVLPPQGARFGEILASLGADEDCRFGLAELNDFLSSLGAAEFSAAVEAAELSELGPFAANYVCALVEQAARLHDLPPPEWTKTVEPLSEPYFAASLVSLRPHLLRRSPVPFRRRQLFVDSSLGDRV
jgi:hypothetical protein